METVKWNADMESCLFYAMMDHKPVGENKNFNMIFIYEKYNNLCEKKLTTEQIWNHLNTMYDMQALNDTEVAPFPNEEQEFCLPDSDYGTLLEDLQQTKSQPPPTQPPQPETKKSSSRLSLAKSIKTKGKQNNDLEEVNNESDSEVESKSSTVATKQENDKEDTVTDNLTNKDELDEDFEEQTSNSDVLETTAPATTVTNSIKTDSRKRTNSKRQSLPNTKKTTLARTASTNKKRKV